MSTRATSIAVELGKSTGQQPNGLAYSDAIAEHIERIENLAASAKITAEDKCADLRTEAIGAITKLGSELVSIQADIALLRAAMDRMQRGNQQPQIGLSADDVVRIMNAAKAQS